MDQGTRSLADEAKDAIAPVPVVGATRSGGAIGATRVKAARRRFLPYVVAGGALSCGYLSVVVATEENLATVLSVAITAGMTVGWVMLGLYQQRLEDATVGPRLGDLGIILLTLPAYAVAGWASAWVGWVVAVALARSAPDPDPPNAWALLIFAAVVIYPLSYVFARRDLDRPDEFTGALLAATREIREEPRSWTILGAFLIGLAWFFGALFALFGLIMGVQLAFSELLARADPGPWLAIAFLVVWIGLSVGGTMWTLRWIDRRRSRSPS